MGRSSKKLLECMNSAVNKNQYRKFQAMYLYTKENLQASTVAKIVGTSVGMIYQWSHSYKRLGIKGLVNKPRGGRQWAYMSFEDEKKLLEIISLG